jgi:acyl carrier protein
MGLDRMDLLFDVESGFDIHVNDDEAMTVRTVGQLHALVLRHLKEQRSRTCLSSAVFYRVRRVLCADIGVPRGQVRPDAPMTFLLPDEMRPEAWRRLRAALGLRLPGLRCPDWFGGIPQVVATYAQTLLAALIVGAVLLPLVALGAFTGLNPGLLKALACPLVFFAMLAFLCLYDRLCAPYAVCVPEGCATMRGLVQTLLGKNYGQLAAEYRTVNEAEVWQALCATVGSHFGVEPDTLTPQTRLDDDLGMD